MATKKKVEEKKIKGAGKAKPVAKPRKPKLQEMHIETRTVTSHDIFSGMEFKIPVSLIGLTGDSLVGQILEKLDPVSSFRDAVSGQVALLLNRLNEKRTQECITSLQLDVEYQADRDGDYLEFHLNSMVDPKGKPDLPYMTGKMAKQLLETAFERFEIEVDLNGAPAYRQKTEFFYEVLDGTNVRMPAVLDYSDVRELYVAVVHQLYMQMMEGNVIEFFTNHDVHVTPEVLKMMATKIGKEHHVEI